MLPGLIAIKKAMVFFWPFTNIHKFIRFHWIFKEAQRHFIDAELSSMLSQSYIDDSDHQQVRRLLVLLVFHDFLTSQAFFRTKIWIFFDLDFVFHALQVLLTWFWFVFLLLLGFWKLRYWIFFQVHNLAFKMFDGEEFENNFVNF